MTPSKHVLDVGPIGNYDLTHLNPSVSVHLSRFRILHGFIESHQVIVPVMRDVYLRASIVFQDNSVLIRCFRHAWLSAVSAFSRPWIWAWVCRREPCSRQFPAPCKWRNHNHRDEPSWGSAFRLRDRGPSCGAAPVSLSAQQRLFLDRSRILAAVLVL